MDEQGDEMLHGFVHHTLFPHLREKAQSGKREQIPTMAMRERTMEHQTVLTFIANEMPYTVCNFKITNAPFKRRQQNMC